MASESTTASYNNPFRRNSSTSNGFVGAPGPGAVPAPLPSTPANAEASIFRTGNATRQQTPTHSHSAGDFAKALQALGKSDAPPPPSTTFQRKKPIKKVRVQSPPPSSPESASAERSYPKYPLPERDEGDESSSVSSESLDGEREDPFQNEAPPIFEDALAPMARREPVLPQPPPQPYTGRGPPPNPFGRTLEDMEQAAKDGGEPSAEHSAPIGKAGLDVEAFKRLLLTGQGPAPGAAGMSNTSSSSRFAGTAADGGSVTDASSISRHSLLDASLLQETPRTSHEISEPEGDEQKRGLIPPPQTKPSARKKPPPPPATRHGKLIKVELGQKDQDRPAALDRRTPGGLAGTLPISPGPRYSVSPVGVNKPLPPPPARSEDDAKESIFDKEAAGKVPEIDNDPDTDVAPPPRPPTPPNTSHSSSTPVQNPASTLRKPAPPPRRHSHVRTDSKSQADTAEEAVTPPRTSLDSDLSRSSSLRLNTAVPTPPPPRRPAAHRNSPSISGTTSNSSSPAFPFPIVSASPTSNVLGLFHSPSHPNLEISSGGTSSSTPISPQQPAAAKPSPPPRPPQRNTSLRKSVGSFPGRHVPASSPEQPLRKPGAIPPPPPPRTRVSSKGSMDGPGTGYRRTSVDSSRQVSCEGAPATLASASSKVATVVEGKEMTADVAGASVTDEAVKAMLADLEALQREVEAARAAAAGTAGGGSR